jgi:HlyD family secretion protein
MKTNISQAPPKALARLIRNKPWVAVLIGVFALVIVALIARASRPTSTEAQYFEVKRSDFMISIVEGGTIEAVREQVIRSEVEGTARVIYIVAEGTTVKKGDLLVELDSSATQDAVNQQQINVEKARFALVQAEQQLEIQRSVVDSETNTANLKVEFAQTDLAKFMKGETMQLRRNAEISITNLVQTLQNNEETLRWTEELHKQGYETKSKFDSDRLMVSKNQLELEKARTELWMIETFDIPKTKRQLEAALQEAKENLDRVIMQGERRLAQYKADVESQKSTLALSETKLQRDMKQLLGTKIYAPIDGMVVYAGGGDRRFSSESLIEEGAVVRNRQELIKLPDISSMKLMVKIHETYINQIQQGQPAYVVLDAMPDQRFRGTVSRIAPLPDSQSRWMNPNLKVYATEIVINDPLPNVKPGVSARAEIVITNLADVLTVPIQAVTTRKGQQVVFLASNPQQPVHITVGMYNIKFIEIPTGLKEGDRVLLSPPFDSEEKDLAGSIITNGEDVVTAGLTNRSALATMIGNRDTGPEGRRNRSGEANLDNRGDATRSRAPRSSDESQLDMNQLRRGAEGEGIAQPRNPIRESGTGPGGARPFGEGGQRQGGQGGQPRFNREEMMKQFDTNGDGELDEKEQAAMRERFGGRRRGGSTNNPAPAVPAAPNSSPVTRDANR